MTITRPVLTPDPLLPPTARSWKPLRTATLAASSTRRATTFNLGDDALNKQYRAILSFNTKLPDTAVITSVTLKIKQQGAPVGANPFLTMGNLLVDMQKGNFGLAALQASDFQAVAGKPSALTILNTPVAGWYSRSLVSANFAFVNKVGNTQFRLHFTKDDNNNHLAELPQVLQRQCSGGFSTGAHHPVLHTLIKRPIDELPIRKPACKAEKRHFRSDRQKLHELE